MRRFHASVERTRACSAHDRIQLGVSERFVGRAQFVGHRDRRYDWGKRKWDGTELYMQ